MHPELRAVVRRRAATLGVLVAGLGVPACEGARTVDRVAALREPVVDGERSPAGGVEDAVLLLRTELDGDELICSASLVAPNLVATARHCVSYLGRGIFSCTAQGELVSVDSGAGELGTHLEAAKLEFFSGTTPRTEPIAYGEEVLSTLSETICTNDIAFVVLDRAVDLPVLPLRLEGKAKRGELVTLVGYGLDNAMSQTNKLDYETQPRTQNDELVIADVGPLQSGQVSTIPPRSLLVEGPAGCLGDSGGPLLARETGAVLGVYSLLGGESCLQADARHLFTHVPLFPLLTEQAFEAAGAEPTPEPVTEPSGEGGGAGEGPGASGGTTATGAGGSAGDAGGATLGSEGGAGAAEPGAAGEPATGGTTAASGGATGTSGGAGVGDTPPKEPAHTPRDNGCTIAASPGHEVPRFALLFALATYLASGVRRFRRR